VVAQTSGAPSPPAMIAAPPPTTVPAGVTTDKGRAGRAVSSRLQSPPDAGPPLDLTLLLSRADSMLGLGDISAARRLYERAAALGSARAATAAGKTYDAAFLATIRAQGIVPDQAAASEWYRKAVALGDREAADRLAKLTPRN
jgi:TPR repeat protein